MFFYKTFFFIVIVSLSSCSYFGEQYELKIPDYFPKPTYKNIKLTKEGVQLGERLFRDPRLSTNGSSCQTCHLESYGFTHHGHALSSVHLSGHGDIVGVAAKDALFGTRNAQPLFNLAFMNEFTWDGAVAELQHQPKIPLEADFEMANTEANVLKFLRENSGNNSYTKAFEQAFELESGETHIINKRTFYSALTQFMLTLVAANSKYDQVRQGKAMYSASEERGYQVFQNKCATCHAEPLFTDNSYRNNGLTVDKKIPKELGRASATDKDLGKQSKDYYKFRVPSLRNLTVTFPYMHDGRIAKFGASSSFDMEVTKMRIMEVLNYYDTGVTDEELMQGAVEFTRKGLTVQKTSNLDSLLQQNGKIGIDLSEKEKIDLIDFLLTLVDEAYIL